ncbi:hypothetical protein [Adlercreutzia shanghongiae]|uniref:Uncharacterized protein n=1 Tax=Adlercreutzia shanghongiae TaxID=3111773 RepID=A0ABU6IYI3_9ACTN|nr:hypothetical protein [Adlercreutzia sp. R22]MEC4294903.1 hypothetical protein [Adlercreutzia sp. R22]
MNRYLSPVQHGAGPYSLLAFGRLTRPTWNSDSVRSRTDGTMRQKYDAARAEDIAYLEEPYRAHELVGPLARPGEKPLAGTMAPPIAKPTGK